RATSAFHDIVLGDTGPYRRLPDTTFLTRLGTIDVAAAIAASTSSTESLSDRPARPGRRRGAERRSQEWRSAPSAEGTLKRATSSRQYAQNGSGTCSKNRSF